MTTLSSYNAKLFEILDQITTENAALSHARGVYIVHHILSTMEATFVQRRGVDLFRFLLTHLCCGNTLSEKRSPLAAVPLLHDVAFPFQDKQVLGLLVHLKGVYGEVNTLERSFLERHQDMLLIKDATLPYIDWKQRSTYLYFEVQKEQGSFSLNESNDLAESLEEMALSLTSLGNTPIPSSEASFKILRYLMSEVSEGDSPHAFIDLCERTADKLSFTICLSRIKQMGSTPLSAFLSHPGVSEKTRLIEGDKEGVILHVEWKHCATRSLVDGRKGVCALIKTLLGPFRDVNGGLLEQIEANFHALSQHIPGSNSRLRLFFNSIYPEEARATLPPSLLGEVYLASKRAMQDSGRTLTFVEQKGLIAAVVKGDKEEKKEWETALTASLPHAFFSQIIDADQLVLSAFAPVSGGERDVFKKKARALFDTWQQKQASQQVLRLCTTSRFTSFDPRTGTEEETSYLHKMLFEGLMRIGKEGKPEMAVAKEVSISEDGKFYRFFLRKSTWSNGMDVTAHDFLYSWQMVLTRKYLAPLDYLFDCIEHAKEIKEGTMPIESLGVSVIDDYTLEVKLLSPCTPFLEICALTLFFPICQAIDQKHPSWAESEGDEYVCNGPFCLEKKEVNGGVVLKKNPLYWQSEKVRLGCVTIPLVSQEEGKKLFLSGQIDALLHYFYKGPISISVKNTSVKTIEGSTFTRYLRCNCSVPPFHNTKVRKALSLAIDTQAIAQFFSKNAEVCRSFYSPEYPFSEKPALKQDISQARRLMIEAMQEDEAVYRTIFKQSLQVLEVSLDIGKLICKQINNSLGVDWDVCAIGLSSGENLKKSFGIRMYQWVDRILDPRYFLGILSNPDGVNNPVRWKNSSFKSLVEQLRTVQTYRERERLLHLAEKILWEELPLIPLFHSKGASSYHEQTQNLHGNRFQEFDVRFSFKSK